MVRSLVVTVSDGNHNSSNSLDSFSAEFLLSEGDLANILQDLDHHWHKFIEVLSEIFKHHIAH